MWSPQSLCPQLFVCTAILCWDSDFLHYSFVNITKCTPSSLYLKINVRLLPEQSYSADMGKKESIHGFICSNCTAENFRLYNSDVRTQCSKQRTMIELRNYCQYPLSFKQKKNSCQCVPAKQPVQPIKDWVKALVKPGKSHMNIVQVNSINKSASTSVYFLVGGVIFLVIFGGMIGMIFYWVKVKTVQREAVNTYKK